MPRGRVLKVRGVGLPLPIPLICHLHGEMANPRTLDRRRWVNNVLLTTYRIPTGIRMYTKCLLNVQRACLRTATVCGCWCSAPDDQEPPQTTYECALQQRRIPTGAANPYCKALIVTQVFLQSRRRAPGCQPGLSGGTSVTATPAAANSMHTCTHSHAHMQNRRIPWKACW